ncbi:unnamed protein product [Calypogeia fissa]
MWCDNTAHTKRECAELDEAVKKGLVKFVGEVGMKKIAFPDNEEPILFNNNKGGMKALAERRAGKRPAEASTSQAEANMFHLEVEPEFGSMEYKKQLADRIREKSGWDAPVLLSSITVEVGAAWDANVEDKRKSGEAEGETRRKEKRRKDEMETSTPAPAPPPASVPESEMEETKKPVRKSPGWILERDVDQVVFPEVMAEKFWNQPVEGFTNGDLFGSMRRDIQEAILLRSKRKWILREEPSNMLGILFGEEEGESKADVFATAVDVVEEESCEALASILE